jgi:hypothetical protein
MAPVIAAERLQDVSKEVRLTDVVQRNIRAGEETRRILNYEATKIYEQLIACRDSALERRRIIKGLKDKREYNLQEREMEEPTGVGVVYLSINGETEVSRAVVNTFRSYFRRMSDLIWHDRFTIVAAYVATPHLVELLEEPEFDEYAKMEMPAINKHVNSLWRALGNVLGKDSKAQKYFKHDHVDGFGEAQLLDLAEKIVYHAVSYRRMFGSMREFQEKGVGPD